MDKIVLLLGIVSLLIAVFKPIRLLGAVSLFFFVAVAALRTVNCGFPPFFDPFDSILLFVITFLIALLISKVESRVGYALSLLFSVPLLFVSDKIKDIPPIIKTPLFLVHVGSAMIAYGFVLSASVIAVLHFFSREKRESFAVLKVAFFFFSLSMVVGGIWAFLAWGDIFPIGPKSLFSFLLWFYLAFLLHVRQDSFLRRYADYFVAFAGVIVLFTFLGVNYLFGGTHGF
ncbi:Cytochrome C assembly protein [Desulfurobacterium pacificum]|uniref:Cytochrome C assembly protein n=1 Tax=Desulfurobacterium pacificum TaxID=240166 RepID=A0ABY1NAU4_9BACT|nr:cytochrome c biogenesis protein CcsA [Desulfurobacterium pacificum]SMP04331.1 Cytochrome C assembly protein [Desulfurobacterium pacificum]